LDALLQRTVAPPPQYAPLGFTTGTITGDLAYRRENPGFFADRPDYERPLLDPAISYQPRLTGRSQAEYYAKVGYSAGVGYVVRTEDVKWPELRPDDPRMEGALPGWKLQERPKGLDKWDVEDRIRRGHAYRRGKWVICAMCGQIQCSFSHYAGD
jgi:hypothetical protein